MDEFVFVDIAGNIKTFFNVESLIEFISRDISVWMNLAKRKEKLEGGKKLYYITPKDIYSYSDSKSAGLPGSYSTFRADLLNDIMHNKVTIKDLISIYRDEFAGDLVFTGTKAFEELERILLENEGVREAESFIRGLKHLKKEIARASKNNEDASDLGFFEDGYLSYLSNRLFSSENINYSKVLSDISRLKNNIKFVDDEKIRFSKEISNLHSEYVRERDSLHHTYTELLRLEAPASHWGNSAKKYRRAGEVWTAFLIISVVVGFIGFSNLFMYWLEHGSKEISLITAQSAIFIMLGSAAYFYFVRVCSRIIFSSFHLMRDAEEREQLTHVYLSLIKDGSIDSDARAIILQSLFSRTDTGLLGGDSSPTMPTIDMLKAMTNDK
ncbi:DUF6161 domain-containing protein [Thiopseudomonas alkaliphila]|uniref:DUF6161 domain-containing protein n=1 Tax=Thiopseudomonas alkaliphila TaxID=1697053 RepID=UPI00069D9298|nr:DUF6161 domain-containing protein [Thiopseudomonas alkaliphila]